MRELLRRILRFFPLTLRSYERRSKIERKKNEERNEQLKKQNKRYFEKLKKQNKRYFEEIKKQNDYLLHELQSIHSQLEVCIQNNDQSNVRMDKIENNTQKIIWSLDFLRHHFERRMYEMSDPNLYGFLLQRWYINETGKPLSLSNPKSFNEKIQWLKLNDNSEIKSALADKYLVREWVKETIQDDILVPLLGVWDRFDDIDFSMLPKEFVLKANHGSGMNIIVRDKDSFNKEYARQRFNEWLHTNYAFSYGLELQYDQIRRRIIAEEFISEIDTALYDYRFFCFNGVPRFIWVDEGSGTEEHKRTIFNMNWEKQDYRVNYPNIEPTPKKPDNLDKMIHYATRLSEQFCFVRIDFYSVNGKVYFGEMTFTPQSGVGKWEDESIDNLYGELIVLPE